MKFLRNFSLMKDLEVLTKQVSTTNTDSNNKTNPKAESTTESAAISECESAAESEPIVESKTAAESEFALKDESTSSSESILEVEAELTGEDAIKDEIALRDGSIAKNETMLADKSDTKCNADLIDKAAATSESELRYESASDDASALKEEFPTGNKPAFNAEPTTKNEAAHYNEFRRKNMRVSVAEHTLKSKYDSKEESLSIDEFLNKDNCASVETSHGGNHSFLRTTSGSGPENRPQSISAFDLRPEILDDIALKTLSMGGSISVLDLAEKMGICFEVAFEVFCRMRTHLYCQVIGMIGNVPKIAITSQGRTRATELFSRCQYLGAAPVALRSYITQIQKQSVRNVSVHCADVQRAFTSLVVDDTMLHQFGTALNSGSSIFLYGPAGSGKTTVAETLSRVLAEDNVWVPYAVEVDSQIIAVFDPEIHRRVADLEPANRDERWVLCHRPAVLVGGELTMEMLELQYNPFSKFYVAPAQMKANNGVLIIDDFGRQRITPEELLNRWIVPLDRRIDFLTLMGGKKIEIPFEMLVVFASNKDPYELLDAAFRRRIQTKIKIGAASDEQFCEIFRRVAAEKHVPFDAGIPKELIDFIRNTLKQELRSCFPRDIVNQVCWAARYEDKKPYLNSAALRRAVEAYFL